jgi:hypothetical protein
VALVAVVPPIRLLLEFLGLVVMALLPLVHGWSVAGGQSIGIWASQVGRICCTWYLVGWDLQPSLHLICFRANTLPTPTHPIQYFVFQICIYNSQILANTLNRSDSFPTAILPLYAQHPSCSPTCRSVYLCVAQWSIRSLIHKGSVSANPGAQADSITSLS